MSLQPGRTCVLIGNLEPMMRLGMTRVLAGDGVEVVAEEGPPAAIVARARRLHPDAVVLSLDDARSRELGEEVRAAVPDAKVILWARDETEMEILDPGNSPSRRIEKAVTAALLSELSPHQPRGERT